MKKAMMQLEVAKKHDRVGGILKENTKMKLSNTRGGY